jgi:hypothetical protein
MEEFLKKSSSQTELFVPKIIEISRYEVKKNQKRNDRKSAEDVTIAVEYLGRVIDGLKKEFGGRPPTRKEILIEMKRIGFEISIATLWRYRGKIKKVRSAVRDLLEEGTYSAYFDHNMELLDYIEEQAIIQYQKKWTNSKTVTKSNNDDIITETHTSEEIAGPKHAFLNILTKVVELRNRATNDDNLDLSCAMLSEEFDNLKDKLSEAERKQQEAEKELKEILRGETNEISDNKK